MDIQDLDNLVMPWPEEGMASDGLAMARIGLRAVMYFGNGFTPALRRELMTIVDQYVSLAGERIRAYQRAGDRRRQSATPGKQIDLGRLRDRVEDAKTPWGLELSGEADISVASHWSLQAVASENGYLLLHFPVTAFVNAAPHTFRGLFQRWCTALRVRHAYAGLGLVLPVGGNDMSAAIDHCGPYATRFVGLDLDYPITVSARCKDGIRTVNWLTAVNAEWLRRVGGERTVVNVAGKDVQALEYSEGSIFVAGPAPQIGDVTVDNFPRAYAQLGHALAPLRTDIPEAWFHPPEGYAPPPGFASKSGWRDTEPEELPALHYTKAWMARFD